MNGATEIIVYRSPMEKAMWDTFSNGQFVPIFAGLIVFAICLVGLLKFQDNFIYRRMGYGARQNKIYQAITWAIWLISGFLGGATATYLWI